MNGWKRLGTILSVTWFLAAGLTTLVHKTEEAVRVGSEMTLQCEGFYSPGGPHHSPDCDKYGMEVMRVGVSDARLEAALVAIIPIPLGWGFVYLVLFLVRWVRKGFAENSQSPT